MNAYACGKSNSYKKVHRPSIVPSQDIELALRHKAKPERLNPLASGGRLLYPPPYTHEGYFFQGNKVPPSVVRDGIVISEIFQKRKPLKRKGGMPWVTEYRDLTHIRDNKNKIFDMSPPILSDYPRSFENKSYDNFIRGLPDDELEWLMLHFHDRWTWETDDERDREAFEALLRERNHRRENGWKIERPTFKKVISELSYKEQKPSYKVQFVSYLFSSILSGEANAMGLVGVLSGPVQISSELFGLEPSKSDIEFLNGFLRRAII